MSGSKMTTGMSAQDHALIGRAADIPTTTPGQYVVINPITLDMPGRVVPIQLRLTLPFSSGTTSEKFPVILLSHGQGPSNNLSSSNGYAPMVQFWAAHGFAVIQPTHLSSRSYKFPEDTKGAPLFWKERPNDMKYIIDNLSTIEDSVGPVAKGKLDHSRLAAVGHSMGAHTTAMLLGLKVTEVETGEVVSLKEPRLKTGIILAGVGDGGKNLSQQAWDNYTFMRHPDFGDMTIPALVAIGDADANPRLSNRSDWGKDNYTMSPGPKDLFSLYGGKHGLGGMSGFDVSEAAHEENPEHLAVVQRLTLGYLRSALFEGDDSWSVVKEAFGKISGIGEIESKL